VKLVRKLTKTIPFWGVLIGAIAGLVFDTYVGPCATAAGISRDQFIEAFTCIVLPLLGSWLGFAGSWWYYKRRVR